MAETKPIEVVEALTYGEDAKFGIHDGPWEFDADRAVAYVTEFGAFTDVLRVEVTVHSRGAEREAAAREAQRKLDAADANAREWERLEPLVGKAVLFRGQMAFLTWIHKGEQPWDPITVECALPKRGDDLAVGTAVDVVAV